jgi:hypothetical protein
MCVCVCRNHLYTYVYVYYIYIHTFTLTLEQMSAHIQAYLDEKVFKSHTKDAPKVLVRVTSNVKRKQESTPGVCACVYTYIHRHMGLYLYIVCMYVNAYVSDVQTIHACVHTCMHVYIHIVKVPREIVKKEYSHINWKNIHTHMHRIHSQIRQTGVPIPAEEHHVLHGVCGQHGCVLSCPRGR